MPSVERDQIGLDVLGCRGDQGVGKPGAMALAVVAPIQAPSLCNVPIDRHALECEEERGECRPLISITNAREQLGNRDRGDKQGSCRSSRNATTSARLRG